MPRGIKVYETQYECTVWDNAVSRIGFGVPVVTVEHVQLPVILVHLFVQPCYVVGYSFLNVIE